MTDSEALKTLLEEFFYVRVDGGLEWVYKEGVTVGSKDPVLNAHLLVKLKEYSEQKETK